MSCAKSLSLSDHACRVCELAGICLASLANVCGSCHLSGCIFRASFFILYFSYSSLKCIGYASTHLDMMICLASLPFAFVPFLALTWSCFPDDFRKVFVARFASLFCLGFCRVLNFARFRANFFYARNPLVNADFARLAKISFDIIVFLCRLWIIQSEGLTFAKLKLTKD